ncbi:hypothetical protein D3C83_106260 [compost metagenome]
MRADGRQDFAEGITYESGFGSLPDPDHQVVDHADQFLVLVVHRRDPDGIAFLPLQLHPAHGASVTGFPSRNTKPPASA